MTKPYIKRKAFSRRSTAPMALPASLPSGELPAGCLDALSLFETLRAYGGKIFRVGEHLRRLEESCLSAGKTLPETGDALARWAEEALAESGFGGALIRLSVHWETPESGVFAAIIRAFEGHPAAWAAEGVRVSTTTLRRPSPRAQDPRIKSSQFVTGVLAHLDHGALGAHELLFQGPAGTMAEGSVSNIFCVKEKRLLTPSAASGILRGVTRDAVIGIAKKRGMDVLETPLTRHEFFSADECFLSNTSSEVLPVVEIDGRRVADGRPGPVTKALAADFCRLVQSELHP